jgi:homoserine kinase
VLTATTSHYDNVDPAVMGGDCNLLHPEGDILALGDAATLHALLLADEISPFSVIRSRNDLP